MSTNKITTDLFLIPDESGGDVVLYAPCLGMVLSANQPMLDLLSNIETIKPELLSDEDNARLNYLIEKGIVNNPDTFCPTLDNQPKKLTLFPSNKCNLKCRYCYAEDSHATAKSMSLDTAVNAINYHSNVLKESGQNTYILELFGGGEPFYDFSLVKNIIEYAEDTCERECFELEVVACTNGVFSLEIREWIVHHMSSLIVSFEGLTEIQNFHRPFPDGSPTFPKVMETLEFFDSNNFPYAIRVTVTNSNLNRLKQTIDFILNKLKCKTIIFEPVDGCGNCNQDQALSCDLNKFADYYIEIESYARKNNIRTIYSGANLEKLSQFFCYVGTNQFAVTPDAYLTNCWEVTSNDHPLAPKFIIGKLGENGKAEFFSEKLNYLKSLSVNNLEYCKDCFAKWHCSGSCVTRIGHSDYNGSRGGIRCETNRRLLANKILSQIET